MVDHSYHHYHMKSCLIVLTIPQIVFFVFGIARSLVGVLISSLRAAATSRVVDIERRRSGSVSAVATAAIVATLTAAVRAFNINIHLNILNETSSAASAEQRWIIY